MIILVLEKIRIIDKLKEASLTFEITFDLIGKKKQETKQNYPIRCPTGSETTIKQGHTI